MRQFSQLLFFPLQQSNFLANLQWYLEPNRRINRSGNNLAQGTSNRWINTPIKKGAGGRVNLLRHWNVGRMKTNDGKSFNPKNPSGYKTWLSSEKGYPVRMREKELN